jgi:hypothetical protein
LARPENWHADHGGIERYCAVSVLRLVRIMSMECSDTAITDKEKIHDHYTSDLQRNRHILSTNCCKHH